MGGKQLGFGDYEQTTAKKRTRRERFLAEMEAVVPWKALIDLIEPHYQKSSSRAVALLIRWEPCCGFICCSSGTTSVIRHGGCTDQGADDAPIRLYRHDQ